MTEPLDDDMTELVDADIPRVDLVGKAANGTAFLIAKAAEEGRLGPAGVFTPAQVRDLIAKAEAPDPETNDDVSKETPVGDEQPAGVAKADDLDAGVVLADNADPMANAPGSPEWEQVDADTARKWTGILARAKNALQVLCEREAVEEAAGCDDDGAWMAVADLTDACCAIDYAISVLAGYAAGEQADADLSAEAAGAAGAVAKALTRFDPGPLGVLEGLGPVVKAGRVLSAANESAIRGAVDALQKVLASLPAPAGDEVAKTTEETTVTAPTTQTSAAPADTSTVAPAATAGHDSVTDVAKADTEPMVACYDADGRLLGAVKPGNLLPLSPGKPVESATDAPADLTPAAPAEVGTPADDVTKTTGGILAADTTTTSSTSAEPDQHEAVLKSYVHEQVKAALDEQRQQYEAVVKGLEDRLTAWENAPAAPRVLTNGATPPEHLLRGQNTDAPADTSLGVQLRKQLDDARTPAEREAAQDSLNQLALAKLAAVRGR